MTPDEKHLEAKKINTTVQKLTEKFREYDNRFKYLLIQLEYNIDEQLLIQWFVVGLLQKIWMHIILDNFNTYEDALTKVLQVEMNEDYPVNPIDGHIKEQSKIMQKSIRDISLKGHEF